MDQELKNIDLQSSNQETRGGGAVAALVAGRRHWRVPSPGLVVNAVGGAVHVTP